MQPNQITGRSLAIWGGTALLIAVIAIGVSKLAGPADTSNNNGNTGTLEPVSQTDWIKGNIDAPVTLIEYSDFQCPACAAYFPLVEQIVSEYKDKVALVYRHFPLQQHRQAKAASYAAEAAGKQGKFWEMYQIIFENQDEWAGKSNAEEIFETYALRVGLDVDQFKADRGLAEITEAVDNDYRSGLNAKVNSTPSFFLNGEKIRNPQNLEGFKALIDAALSTTT